VPRTFPKKLASDAATPGTRFMLELDEPLQATLQPVIEHVGTSNTTIIRQRIAQANAEDFPNGWHMRAAARRAPQVREKGTGRGHTSR
jgi:hypothetical protein